MEVPRGSQAVNLGWLLLVPGLGPLSKRYGGSLRLAVVCLIGFRKLLSMSQDQPFISKSHCLQFEWAPQLGEMEPQGISRVGQTVVARLMESQIWHPPAGSVALWREDSEKGTMSSVHLFVWEKAIPQLLS